MPLQCSICKHDQRLKIEQAIINGVPLRSIAFQYETTHTTLKRHKPHIKADIEQIEHISAMKRGFSLHRSLLTLHKKQIKQIILAKEHLDKSESGSKEYSERLNLYSTLTTRAINSIQQSGIVAIAAKDSELTEESNRRAIEIGELFINVVSNANQK